MLDRHLNPDEIDLLLDMEDGFSVQPLRAHVRVCASCKDEVEKARAILLLIEDLPHFNPSRSFADGVMSKVQVFEPWHVSVLNSVNRFLPSSRPARVVSAVGLTATAAVAVSGSYWLINRADIGILMANAGIERVQESFSAATSDVVLALVGREGLQAWATNGLAFGFTAAAGFVIAAGLIVAGLRQLTIAHSRREQNR